MTLDFTKVQFNAFIAKMLKAQQEQQQNKDANAILITIGMQLQENVNVI